MTMAAPNNTQSQKDGNMSQTGTTGYQQQNLVDGGEGMQDNQADDHAQQQNAAKGAQVQQRNLGADTDDDKDLSQRGPIGEQCRKK